MAVIHDVILVVKKVYYQGESKRLAESFLLYSNNYDISLKKNFSGV